MALEDLTGADKFIDNLVPANPADADDVREGAAHIRGVKNVLVNQFPNLAGPVTLTDAQLNAAAIQGEPAAFSAMRVDVATGIFGELDKGTNGTEVVATLNLYREGLSQWALQIAADGSMQAYVGGDFSQWTQRWRTDGICQFRFGLMTDTALRNNSGVYAASGGWDVGKAPGVARGVAVTNATTGIADVAFGFVITDPVIVCTPRAPAGTIVVVATSAQTNGGFAMQAFRWVAPSSWVPVDCAVDWWAVSSNLVPSQ